ncbi:MAG TPA: hypothetical protein VLE44_01840 [Candidatus Saccharimonadales bacterium]|nr:hypothetical protein [Candidatus Saccharimonadales bacterium]
MSEDMSRENIETQQGISTQEIKKTSAPIGQPIERRLSRPEAKNPKARIKEEDIIDIAPENIKDVGSKKEKEPKTSKKKDSGLPPRSTGTSKKGGGGLPPRPPEPPSPPTPEEPEEPEPSEEHEMNFESLVKALIEDEITDEKVKNIGNLILGRKINAASLGRFLNNGDDMAIRGDVDINDWAKLAGLINTEIDNLETSTVDVNIKSTRGKEKTTSAEKFGEAAGGKIAEALYGKTVAEVQALSHEEQKKYVRGLIESIETNTSPDSINSDKFKNLEDILNQQALTPENASEIRARLRLHACFILTSRLAGKPEDFIKALRENVVTEMRARNLLLQGGDLEYLYKESEIKISEAHSIIEKLAFEGFEGTNMPLFYSDKDGKRVYVRYAGTMTDEIAEMVQGYILEQMGGNTTENRKALTLSERLAKATFEYSLWKEFNSVDPITKAAYLSNVRKSEQKKTDGDFGPEITIPLIDGFGLSFLRWSMDLSGNHLVHDKNWKDAKEKSLDLDTSGTTREAMEDLYKANVICKSMGDIKDGGPLDQNYDQFSLNPDKINFRELPVDSYAIYLSSYLPAVLMSTAVLLKSDFKASETGSDNITDWFGNLTKADFNIGAPPADPTNRGIFRLTYYFSIGMVEESIRQATLFGWDSQQMGTILGMLKNGVVNKATGSRIALLSSKQVEQIKKATNPYVRLGVNTFMTALGRIVRTRPG